MPIKRIRLAFAITLAVINLTNCPTGVQAQLAERAVLTATPRNLPTLRLGMKGQEVKRLQEVLKRLGFYHGSIASYFDRPTEVAVIKSQRHYKLLVNGVVAPATWEALLNNSNVPVSNQEEPDLSTRGTPGRRTGGASRGSCPDVKIPLTALVPATEEFLGKAQSKTLTLTPPESVLGLTIAEYPTFWFYVPYSRDDIHSVEFVLLDDKDNNVYNTTLTLSETPGVASFRLPSTAEPLEIGKSYHWYYHIKCDPQKPSRSVFVEGWVQRVAPSPALMSQLNTATPRERVALYAAAGIWHEAQTTLAELRRTEPENAAIATDWSELLQSIGLEELAQKPIVAGLHP